MTPEKKQRLRRLMGATLCACMIAMASGKLLAASCWSEFEAATLAASRQAEQCAADIPWNTPQGALYGQDMMRLCGAQQLSDAYQAAIEYGVCMSAGTVIGWFT